MKDGIQTRLEPIFCIEPDHDRMTLLSCTFSHVLNTIADHYLGTIRERVPASKWRCVPTSEYILLVFWHLQELWKLFDNVVLSFIENAVTC